MKLDGLKSGVVAFALTTSLLQNARRFLRLKLRA